MELSSRLGANGIGDLEILSEDGGLVFGRGWREGAERGRRDVLIVLPASEQPTPTILDRLAHEYTLKDELDSTWAVRPLELVEDRGQTVLVLEDPGGELLGNLLGTPMETGRFLRLAIGVATTLGKVHQRGLIHKDVKPGNILVNTASGEVRLTGFGMASRLTRERQLPDPPEVIAGTLAYMAPEQTGRMNRSIDSRSDLYSLGITFYEMLTGSLPFMASDPMEWIHCHIARLADAPGKRASGIPAILSSIVMKLLEKTADERYQTAAGVEADLRRCLLEWQSHGHVDPFPLGARDASDRLLFSEGLYGREREIAALLASFDRVVAQGPPELVLVSGYSGVGKSSVVNELPKVLVPPRGLFAAGKFDQYKRDIPYATLAQAFQTLIRQILVKNEAEVERWRGILADALGAHGQLIVNLVPELELIIGKQLAVPDLPPQEAQNRFQFVFRRFIGAFAGREHPLVLFLDDLQWLDAATLDLIEHLIPHSEVRYLLLVGAYRDNEVGPAHPLLRTLEAIRKADGKVREIVLAPLGLDDVGWLTASALHCDLARARSLARLVHEKTGGNPFFAIQFLTELAEEGLLSFDAAAPAWRWDTDRIRGRNYTGNVVDLMAGRLRRLSAPSQEALKQFACLGNAAETLILILVHGETMQAGLEEAVYAGLVVQQERTYKFLHDRIQQAAYSLISDEQTGDAHLRIGRAMLANLTADQLTEHLFDVANQLNRGAAILIDRDEKTKVAKVDLRAGRKAKASAAYASARVYFSAGMALLDECDWRSQYELMINLRLECAECELLTGHFDQAEQLIAELLQRAASKVDEAAVYQLKVQLYLLKSENRQAVATALTCLRGLGIDMPAHPTQEQVQAEYEAVWQILDARSIESLIDLPPMMDPELQAAMQMLSYLYAPAYFTDFRLCCLMLSRMVKVGLQYGTSGAAAAGYALWGSVVLAGLFHRYGEAYRFGKLACDLVERFGFIASQAKVYVSMGAVAYWRQPIAASIDFLKRAFDAAIETGDPAYACFSLFMSVTFRLLRNDPLDEVSREAEMALDFIRKAKFGETADIIINQQRFIATMRGRTATFSTFSDAHFDEATFEARFTGRRMPLMILYWVLKLKARFLSGDYADALAAAGRTEALLPDAASQYLLLDYFYYSALTLAALYENAAADERNRWREVLITRVQQLGEWAENYQPTFGDKYALVSAEIARIEGRELDAQRLYEEAIRSARDNGFVQNEAVAYEVAARFYSARGFETFADAYLRGARDCYLRWGADGKVRQLHRLHPHLTASEGQSPTAVIGSALQHLDAASVVKASQALSREIELPKLIERLMTIALENAGADRGLLILPADEDYLVQAQAQTTGDQVEVVLGRTPITRLTCPDSLLRYVIRTRESVIIGDATRPNLFSADDYLRGRRVKSILCLPLIKQGRLTGLLYLENTLTSHVFTADRVAILELLAAQAAISLENTRLYNDLQEREGKVRRLIDSNIIGIFVWDFEGRIIETNEAFLHLLGHSRDDLVTGRARWTEWTPPEWSDTTERAVAELRATGTSKAYEKEFFRKDGARVPVLIGSATFGVGRDAGVSFVLDLTERKQAEAALRQSESYLSEAQAELAHVNRVATVGQLTASIAHEINQPLAGIASNGAAGLNWLNRKQPDLAQARDAFSRIVRDSARAGDVIRGLRALVKKSGPQLARLDIDEVIREVLALTAVELRRHGVLLETNLAAGDRPVLGDRVQLQQVLLNLIMNGVEAMRGVTGRKRELMVSSALADKASVLVSVEDTGAGFGPAVAERLFEPFFTTKSEGLGMGLSICRSIVEGHRGRLWASPRAPYGVAIHFTVPVELAQ